MRLLSRADRRPTSSNLILAVSDFDVFMIFHSWVIDDINQIIQKD